MAATGAPMLAHSFAPGRVGDQQAFVLEQAGADPIRVIIGPGNDATDVAYLTGLLGRGFNLGLD